MEKCNQIAFLIACNLASRSRYWLQIKCFNPLSSQQMSLEGLDSQMGSVVRQSAKVPGSIPGGAKVLGTDGICKYLPVSVSSYVEICLCLLCSVCID